MAEARQSVLHDQLVVLEDRVQFIFECLQLAAQGKWVVAAKMLMEMEADAEETTANLGAWAVPPGTYCQTPLCHLVKRPRSRGLLD